MRTLRNLLLAVATVAPVLAQGPSVVISQIYGGGGNSGAQFNTDFVEIFNRSGSAVSLNGYSIQYTSSAGTSWSGQKVNLPNVSLGAGKYFLIGLASGANGVALPTPDATGTFNMSATAGKILLSSSQTAETAACPTSAAVVDFVPYGTNACTPFAPGVSNTLALFRAASGCTWTGSASSDFATAAPAPRNTVTAANVCGGGDGPSATGSATPGSIQAGNATTLAATPVSGSNPASSSYVVSCNLTAIGGSASFSLPATAFSASFTLPVATPASSYNLPCTVTDNLSRTGNFNIALTVTAPPPAVKRIYEITGSGASSPLAGTTVTTSGIVTGIRATTGSTKGFYIQSAPADQDADPNTSEGLLIFIGSASLPACAAVGNQIQITGTVLDFVSSTAPVGSVPLTELSATSNCTVITSGNPLPAPVTITSALVAAGGSATQSRKLLSMLVAIPSAIVVGPSLGFNIGSEATATKTPNGQYFVTLDGVARPFRGAGIQATRRPADAAGTVPSWNGNPEAFRIDTNGLVGGATFEVATGSTVTGIAGIMDYLTSGGQYQIYTSAAGAGTVTPAAPGLSATPVPAPLPTDITVANANVERFFNSTDDGNANSVILDPAAYQGRLNKLSLAIRNVLRMPDIITMQEVEGPKTGSPLVYPVPQDIVNKLNADAMAAGQGNPNYNWCEFPTNDVGAIAVAILYKQTKVALVDCVQFGVSTTYNAPGGGASLLNDRPPVVLRANVTPAGSDSSFPIRIVVNHLRSLNGIDEPGAANGDRVRTKRNQQAIYLAKLITGQLGSEQNVNWNTSDNLLVAGDMNAFDVSDGYADLVNCIAGNPALPSAVYLTAAQLAVDAACPALVSPNLVNLTAADPAQRYSYSFSGSAQRIDHILVNGNLNSRVRSFAYARNNADFPEGPTYRNNFNRPERYSDHDAPVVYLALPVEVSSRVRLNATPLVFNRAAGRYNGRITLTNIGAAALTGPLYVFFKNLPAGVTMPGLPTSNGIPYLTIPGGLASGDTSVPAAVSFANPANIRISYTNAIFDGTF